MLIMIPIRVTPPPTPDLDLDQREGPDNQFGDLAVLHKLLCPDHDRYTFTTQCGVTRCFYCNRVVG
jgi:hypothetical protein